MYLNKQSMQHVQTISYRNERIRNKCVLFSSFTRKVFIAVYFFKSFCIISKFYIQEYINSFYFTSSVYSNQMKEVL